MNNQNVRDEETALITDLGKNFIERMMDVEPAWKNAYFRFVAQDIGNGCSASYEHGSKVELLDLHANEDFVDVMMEKSSRLAELSGKEKMVLLLNVTSDFDFNIHFEHEDLERWKITKQNGQSGLPMGI